MACHIPIIVHNGFILVGNRVIFWSSFKRSCAFIMAWQPYISRLYASRKSTFCNAKINWKSKPDKTNLKAPKRVTHDCQALVNIIMKNTSIHNYIILWFVLQFCGLTFIILTNYLWPWYHYYWFYSGILRDKTMFNKLMYIPTDDTQNFPSCRLLLVV